MRQETKATGGFDLTASASLNSEEKPFIQYCGDALMSNSVQSSSSVDNRSNLHLLAERVQSSSSSCSAVATIGTPSSPRSIRSGFSSISHHGVGVPINHPLVGIPNGGGNPTGTSTSSGVHLVNPDLSIQSSVYSPLSRVFFTKRPSSALSEGSLHSSTAVAIGDSLPRDDELTTVDDEENEEDEELKSLTSSDNHVDLVAAAQRHSIQLNNEQVNTPIHLERAKNGEGSSIMGGRKAFESSNYADNLDELGAFTVRVQGSDLGFNCAHFVAYDGYRERLHGHSYQVKMEMGGKLNPDGYVVDFNMCKRLMRETCKTLNERMIIPMKSDVLSIKIEGGSVDLVTQKGERFMFPESDCLCLPIMHSTVEELAAHVWNVTLQAFTPQYLQTRGVTWLEISVSERPTQEAQYRRHIPVPPQL